jgi:hypothetical protein
VGALRFSGFASLFLLFVRGNVRRRFAALSRAFQDEAGRGITGSKGRVMIVAFLFG